MVTVREILDYNAEVRRRYLATLATLPWSEVVKNREASWHSLRNILIHTMGAMNHWLNFLEGRKLNSQRQFENVGISAEDVLIHFFEEEVHHRGELIALLWQMNLDLH